MQLRGTSGRRRSFASHRQGPHGRLVEPRLRRLNVEPLESRRLLSVFVVENLDDSGDGSLRAAIEAANVNPGDDTIEFAVAGTIQVQSALPRVNDPTGGLLIDGTTAPGYVSGADPIVVLDGSETGRTTGLTVQANSNEIRGLKIHSFSGSGIRNLGTLTVADSTIAGNSTSSSGGGIYTDFFSTSTVTYSTITGNSARDGGGGICGNGTLTLTHSTINENSAGYGGGVYSSYESILTVANSIIVQNSANGGGGGIHSGGATVTVVNSMVQENWADRGGGGIFNNRGTLTLENSIIMHNSANDTGGGMKSCQGTLTVGDSTIAENSASTNGGGICHDSGTLTLTDSTIAGNSADSYGGGIWSYGTLTLTNSIITGNSAADGGGIYSGGWTVTLTNSTVAGNSANYHGGGIRSGRTLTVTNSTITGNSAGERGGGIRSFGTLTVANSSIAQNSGGDDGGGICSSDTLTVTNSSIAQNSAADDGGGIYSSCSTLSVSNSTITENTAGWHGGGIHSDFGTLRFTNSTIADNSAKDGGAISTYRGTLTLSDSSIVGNLASSRGGGICGVQGTLTVTNSTIVDNWTWYSGGGIYSYGTLIATNLSIVRNSADRGGGIYSTWGTSTVTNSTVVGNSAGSVGGGIYGINHATTLVNSTVAGNSAFYGGGVYNDHGTLTLSDSIIAQNDVAMMDPDVRGSLAAGSGYDLIGIWTGDGAPPPDTLVGTVDEPLDPRLGPLGDYGGATWTMPLLADSPAVDAGDPDFDPNQFDPPLLTDQRGLPRLLDGDGDGSPRIDMGAFEYVPPYPVVFGRHVFYNASSFDGEDPAANEADDGAIAFDKAALLPSQTATFANYTSYSGGINGIMVDVAELAGTPTGEDFEFRVGNDDDPGGWSPAATPEVSVREGAGIAGSDRITLVWPENTIQKQWLQVTVLPGGNTGLLEPDVFYFGNAIGESGNSATEAKVNATDMLAARNNQRNFLDPAPIDFDYDYDRDARVNATDMLIARNNQTSFLDALDLITVPNKEAAAAGCWSPGFSLPAQPENSYADDLPDSEGDSPIFPAGKSGQSPGKSGQSPGSAQLAWLYQFDELGTKRQPSEKGEGDDGPLEKVLAAYGL